MNSPLDEIISWFKELSPAQQMDVAYIISPMPGLHIDPGSENIAEVFLEQINSLRNGKVREQALIFCLKVLIENFIISRRSDPDSWKETKAILEDLSKGSDNPTFAEMAQRKEFEGAQWVSSCRKWNEMAKVHLKNENISHWFNSH